MKTANSTRSRPPGRARPAAGWPTPPIPNSTRPPAETGGGGAAGQAGTQIALAGDQPGQGDQQRPQPEGQADDQQRGEKIEQPVAAGQLARAVAEQEQGDGHQGHDGAEEQGGKAEQGDHR